MQMHFFDSMRRYSRNSNALTKAQKQAQDAPTAPLPPRQPSHLTPSSSHSSLVSEKLSNGSSSQNSPSKPGRSKAEQGNAPKATHTTGGARDENSAILPTESTLSSQRSTYSNSLDLYTHNDLNSFSFGAASSSSPAPYQSIDPLSLGHDDEFDDSLHKADTTPRPSMIARSSPRSHSSQLPQMAHFLSPTSLPPPPRPLAKPARTRRPSNVSTHTFGSSSASASASSLSSAVIGSSPGSRHGGSTTTPHTSANTLTSENLEEEHRHPLPHCPPTPSYSDDLSVYTSEEEFDSDLDERDYEHDIDISSVIHEDGYNNNSQESLHSTLLPRRGSLAVPIPSPNSVEGRDREDSIATVRRASRSLEGLRSDASADSHSIASLLHDNRPLPAAPTSVPESETDWRDLRRRSIQKGKERELASRAGPSAAIASSSASTAASSSVLDGFDSSWNIDPTTGIVNLEWDQSEMADIVGGIQGPRSADRNFRRGSSSTNESDRRMSTTSTNSDPFNRYLNKWGGQQYRDEKLRWTFAQERHDSLAERRHDLERDRHAITSFFHPKSSFDQSSSYIASTSSSSVYREYGDVYKDVKEPKPKDTQPWKGMAIDAEEVWSSGTNGVYRVTRKSQQNVAEPGKAPQQRLNISHHRMSYPQNKRDLCDGPSVTIHKHSKATGFSISRHYRTRPTATSVMSLSGRASTSSRSTTAAKSVPSEKRSTNMILLAPRKVQESFTSTTTTRMLESHGLLSENGRHSPRDLERMERERKERKKRELEKEKQRLKDIKKEESLKSKSKSRLRIGRGGDKSESSGGSVADDKWAGTSRGIAPSRPSADHSVRSAATLASDRTVMRNPPRRAYDGSGDDDDDDDDDLDLYDLKRRQHSKTPHSEAFASIPNEEYESSRHQGSPPHGLLHSFKILNTKNKNSALSRHLETSFDPPWPVASPRQDKKGIVEDLNTSFQDVGLLPATGEARGSSVPAKRKRQQHHPDSKHHSNKPNKDETESPNVFHSFSAEYLYMLLPLWPGETDPLSAKKFPYPVPNIPVESRQYLLIYYKEDDVSTKSDAEMSKPKSKPSQKDKKRSSPTSSRDSTHKQVDILFEKFHFCARVVSYSDIQGSGIRSPDVGLSVLGPLQEACETMPTQSYIDTFQVIGVCNSRSRGIEFVPEGLEKLGLTRHIPDPTVTIPEAPSEKRFSITGVEEAEEVSDTILMLTPIGRAVVEMAWLGSMALNSYGPTPPS